MKARLLALTLAACGAHPTIVTGHERPPGTIWLVGIARDAKLGAVVETAGRVVHCGDRPAWPAEALGGPVVVAGSLTTREDPPPPVGPQGERSAGAEGPRSVLSPCATPPVADDGLVAAERALFAALAARDRVALDRLADASLVVRVPGQPDVDRAAFLQAAAATPGEILGVDGERLAAHRAGDAGIVSGVQVARLRVDGRTVEDRATFVDVFVRRDGAWRLAFALYVPH